MLSFLVNILVFLLCFYIGRQFYVRINRKKVSQKFTEHELVKKFNRVVKRITERNLDTIKEELLDILDEYKFVKGESFIESKTLLEKCKDTIDLQIASVCKQENELVSKIRSLKEAGDGLEDERTGALYVAELEKLNSVKQKLSESLNSITDKIRQLDSNINSFNHRFAIKKSEIIIMIANAATVNNVSSIDIQLNDLVTEFNTKAKESEIRQDVTEKIYGVKNEIETDLNFNESEYIEKFRNFSV